MLVPFLERQSFPIRGNNDGNDNFILLLRFEGGVGGGDQPSNVGNINLIAQNIKCYT